MLKDDVMLVEENFKLPLLPLKTENTVKSVLPIEKKKVNWLRIQNRNL